jgi:hypothetical protein
MLTLSTSSNRCAAAAPTARRRAGPAPPLRVTPLASSAPRRAAAAASALSHSSRLRPAAATADVAARLAASLSSAEESEDVMLVADVLAEARVSGVSLPPDSVEAGIRALANGGQFKRAADLFATLPWASPSPSSSSSSPLPHPSTVLALFAAAVQAPLGAGEPDATARADAARRVLDALREAVVASSAAADAEEEACPSPLLDLSPAFNRVVRAYARCPSGARLDAALALLGEMVADDGVAVDNSTFGSLAASCIEAGRAELAEEVLDLRDYF